MTRHLDRTLATGLWVAQQARKEARAADHAYLTTPATRWQTGGNVSFHTDAIGADGCRATVETIQRANAAPQWTGPGTVSSPPITSGGCGVPQAQGAAVTRQLAQAGRSGPLTIQRPGPVDCRADAVLPVGSVAAVGAPLYALVHYCRAAGLPEPVPEYRFHPTRMWRFDYAFPLHKIAVEVDGGVWTQGRHTRGAGYIADMEKMNAAAKLGWRVLKYTPQTLGVAIDDLRVVLVALA